MTVSGLRQISETRKRLQNPSGIIERKLLFNIFSFIHIELFFFNLDFFTGTECIGFTELDKLPQTQNDSNLWPWKHFSKIIFRSICWKLRSALKEGSERIRVQKIEMGCGSTVKHTSLFVCSFAWGISQCWKIPQKKTKSNGYY